MSFASCAVSRGRLSRLVDTSPDAGAPPSLFHRLIALAFMSASVDGFFALLLMPQLCHGCRGLSMASRPVRFQKTPLPTLVGVGAGTRWILRLRCWRSRGASILGLLAAWLKVKNRPK